ncbi:hypothetical protein CC86DRAFT_428437 [Ophiobolus disseminans]|uniref:Uncharacterized protein n=1 Tax=Ophiobolus disseminans TaxID=1469910 RepID=A0A6A6ZIZ4_9PLEO|nr:hypothetical protein CC86DRAFT_428437 [Ophiobolus disseminans]
MSSYTDSGDSAVYVGFWVDHDNGPFLTLANQNATALITFLAVAVTFAGNRSWKVVRFVLYHALCSKSNRSAPVANISRRLEVILRNVVTAGSTLWALVELTWDERLKRKASQSGRPRGYGERNKRRRIVTLGLIAAIHFIAFIVAGILTSRIVVGRLVVSRAVNGCGQWTGRNVTERSSVRTWQSLRLNETLDADNYVRNCYPLGVSRSILDCGKFVKRSLPYEIEHDAPCPFEESICSDRPNGAVVLDSGPILFRDLGINSNLASKMAVQRRSVCAVVPDKPFIDPRTLPITGEERVRSYLFYLPADPRAPRGMPFVNQNVSGTFDLQAYHLNFSPERIIELVRPVAKDHDPSLIFLRSNGVQFESQSDDPWFSVHTQTNFGNKSDLVVYETDRFLNIIACKESVRFCRSPSNTCSPWTGLISPLDTTSPALTTLARPSIHNATPAFEDLKNIYSLVALSVYMTSIPGSIQGRPASSALQAARYLNGITQEYVAPEQWKIELEYWFAVALARMQLAVFNTIEKPPGVDAAQAVNQWDGTSLTNLCGRVKFQSRSHTTLSTTGVAVVLGFVLVLTILSFVDVVFGCVPGAWARRMTRDWNRLENLRMLEELEGWWREVGEAADPLQVQVDVGTK